MTLTSKKTYQYYQGSSFDIKAASLCQINLCFDANCMSIAIIDSASNLCLAIESLPLSDLSYETIETGLQSSKLAKIVSLSNAAVGFNYPFWTLVPQQFYQEESISSFLKFNYSNVDELKYLSSDFLPEMQAVLAYGSETIEEYELKTLFPGAKLMHPYSGLIERAWLQKEGSPKLRVLIKEDLVFLILTDENQVQGVNQFKCQTIEDVAYFILYFLDQSNYDTSTIQVEVFAEKEIKELLKSVIKRYVPLNSEPIWNLSLDKGIPDSACDEFADLLALHLCV